jgi:hypothetical protein
MMSRVAVVMAVASLSAGAAFAHHSFAAMYDATKPVTLKGTVTQVQFKNPHIWIFVDVADGGNKVNWACEGGQPTSLFRNGWRPDSVKVGDNVTMEGFSARTGKPVCNVRNLTMADGTRVFAGAVGDGAPDRPAAAPAR